MLHIPGRSPNFAIILCSSLFENRNIAMSNDNVTPAPPGTIKLIQNDIVNAS